MTTAYFAVSVGTPEALIVGAIILLVFGSAWLPKLARNMGRTKVELEKAKTEFDKAKAEVTEPFAETKETFDKATKSVDQVRKTSPKDAIRKSLE